jgi:hypothetical protein
MSGKGTLGSTGTVHGCDSANDPECDVVHGAE